MKRTENISTLLDVHIQSNFFSGILNNEDEMILLANLKDIVEQSELLSDPIESEEA